ncbi:MAG TPA: hypothetical protein VG475_13800 [Pseudolabrys sp.]|nr:hypothetical protein [Pseudolabrys sp.]
MADKPTTPQAPGGRRRKREAPTIDLTATEVPPAAEANPPQSEPPPKMRDPQPEPAPQSAPQPGAQFSTGSVAAGIAGAAVMSFVMLALWYTGFSLAPAGDTGAPRAQVAALQKQVQELASRAAPADGKALEALRARVGKIEEDIAKLPSADKAVAERLSAADNAMKSLGVALTALNRRSDDATATVKQALERAEAAEKAVKELQASVQNVGKVAAVAPAALDAMQQRLAALEQSAQAAHAEIARTASIDTAARLALSAAALRAAVESGAPYADALAQTKVLGADAAALAPLQAFAASGLPGDRALARELSGLMAALVKAAGAGAAPAGFLERLQANAGQLVRVRPLDAPAGDDPGAVLARLEVEAANADIDGALADLGKLPEPARKPAQAWIAKAKSRQAALAAARDFAAAAARALGKP